jgi:acetyl-CoA C-acetyltransferase
VGVSAINEHADDPRDLGEPLALMERALGQAAEDAGSKRLLAEIDSIWMPRGFWSYADPGRLLAERFGSTGVRSVIAEVGVLQTTILGAAASALAQGQGEVAVILGGEARDRASRLQRQGLEVPLTEQLDGQPDDTMTPDAEIMGQFEIDLGLITPTIQYAMIDNALRYHEGQSMEAHRAELGALWGDFNRVAVANEDAWNRTPMTPDEIVAPTEANRMLAYPYTKSLVSQWNVNQAGCLILCSYAKAKALGLDERRFIYPLAVADSEYMVTLSERGEIHRSPGFALAGDKALGHIGRSIEEIDLFELYSCFPAAVRVQQRELGLDLSRRVTQTGGMTFGGGPLNNFVIQSWVKMVESMRAESAAFGMVTAVSGLLTKQGVSVLGREPSVTFGHAKVTEAAREQTATVRVDREAQGRARVSAYTVSHDRNAAQGVPLVCDFEDGRRTLRVVADEALAERGAREELCGREVEVGPEGSLRFC